MPVLVVQLGHCYRTSGATGTTGEQGYATRVGDACRALLHGRGGWSVRTILADAPMSEYSGDAFAAIHCDGSTNPSARGASVGYRTPEGQTLAQAWKRAYSARGWPGFRPDNYTSALAGYYGVANAVSRGNRRAMILECGFRTNPEDLALLDGPGGPERVALSIGDALGVPTGSVQPPAPDPFKGVDPTVILPASPDDFTETVVPNPFVGPTPVKMWIGSGWGARVEGTAYAYTDTGSLQGDMAPANINVAPDNPDVFVLDAGIVIVPIRYKSDKPVAVTFARS
jgi:hypothetical protein